MRAVVAYRPPLAVQPRRDARGPVFADAQPAVHRERRTSTGHGHGAGSVAWPYDLRRSRRDWRNRDAVPAGGHGERWNGATSATAIDLQNQSKDFAYNLTAQLRKRYSNNWEASAGVHVLTRSRRPELHVEHAHLELAVRPHAVRDSGRCDHRPSASSISRTRSLASGTYTLNWLKKLATDFSCLYQGGRAHRTTTSTAAPAVG